MPATYEAVSGETIEAQQHNDPLEDLEQDANAARPVIAGGTGGVTAIAGHDNLFTTSSNIASATTTNLATATGVVVNITGTTTITGLGTVQSGALRVLVFAGILTFTHNGTSLILPGAANITTAAGDVAAMVSLGSGNWKCIAYQAAGGILQNASETARGIVELATTAEVITGSDTARAVTPAGVAAKTIVECISGVIVAPADGDYRLVVKIPFGGTITEAVTRSTAGTGTGTFKVNTTALGGTANSISSSEQAQAHASTNTFAADDDIVLTISSASSLANLSFTIKFTRALG